MGSPYPNMESSGGEPMSKSGFRLPNNDVVVKPDEGFLEFYTVHTHATAAKMLPGIIVKLADVANEVLECDASGNAIGFLAYQSTPADWRPATRDTAYAVGDRVGVHRGAGRRQMGRLASGQNLGAGAAVKLTTDGYLTEATIGTDDVIGDLVDAVNATSAAKICWIYTRK
jgi:hypothetical protein